MSSLLEPGSVVAQFCRRLSRLSFISDPVGLVYSAMFIIGVAAYGSHARKEGGPQSDFDLLGITTGDAPNSISQGKVCVSNYPLRQIICRAGLGDLFVLHIASEAKVLYEAWPVFEQIKRSFRYKDEYGREIRLAADAGWFLARHESMLPDPRLRNEKMAWCTRTILIAKAASERRPIFSARRLAEYAGWPDVQAIIDNKDNPLAAPHIAARFHEFLAACGVKSPAPVATLTDEKARFDADRNLVGSRLARIALAAAWSSRTPEHATAHQGRGHDRPR